MQIQAFDFSLDTKQIWLKKIRNLSEKTDQTETNSELTSTEKWFSLRTECKAAVVSFIQHILTLGPVEVAWFIADLLHVDLNLLRH